MEPSLNPQSLAWGRVENNIRALAGYAAARKAEAPAPAPVPEVEAPAPVVEAPAPAAPKAEPKDESMEFSLEDILAEFK